MLVTDLIKAVKEGQEKSMNKPEQEPVAWAHYTTFNNLNTFEKNRFTATLSKKETNACCVPLYTAPQRTWVGLTDEEIQAEWLLTPQHDKAEGIWFGHRLEAKLKEKNT
jgi:hypothetical protein